MASNDEKNFPSRKWYRRVPFLSTTPIKTRLTTRNSSLTPSPRKVEGGFNSADNKKTDLPESTANWLSILTFNWLNPALRTGYTRPLQFDDLYDMPSDRLAVSHADRLENRWSTRLKDNKDLPDSTRVMWWKKKRRAESSLLAFALNDVCFRWFWMGGLLKLTGDMLQMVSPLLIRFLIATLSNPSQQALGAGFGYAVGLFALLVVAVTANVHGFYRAYTTGVLLRGALIHTIYRRALMNLTDRAKLRNDLGAGKLMSLMSADVTRVDYCCSLFHSAWTSIFQIFLCFGLTTWSIGYSSLPGFGLLALLYPLQRFMMASLLHLRRVSMPFTDARVKAVVEAVSTIRLVKTNAYEKALLTNIGKLRSDEVVYIRKRMLLRALNTAVSYTAPTLAAVVSIVCYGATNETGMESSVVFSTLAFFLLLRTPLQALPLALSAIADARVALERLAKFMLASEGPPVGSPSFHTASNDCEMEKASAETVIQIEDAIFTHPDGKEVISEGTDLGTQNIESLSMTEKQDHAPTKRTWRLQVDRLMVRKNQLVCIVGPVASGKSSMLGALLGDMQLLQATKCQLRLENASTPFQIALAPQTAWLLSDTIRENVVFGRPLDLKRYHEVLVECCLHQDLKRLAHGDMTVVGELGVSLSGGQKQRISLARAVYGRSPLLFLDDCFSALDAHVGADVFEMVVNQSRKRGATTIVLVTHSMTFARQADHVVYMEQGRIVQQGSYETLCAQSGPFSLFVGPSSASDSHSDSESTQYDTDCRVSEDEAFDGQGAQVKKACTQISTEKQAIRGKEIMQNEERLVGSVSGLTYVRYVQMGKAWLTVPLFFASIIIFQGTSVVSPLWLSWWQSDRYTISRGAYIVGFAGFGIGQSLGLFCMSATSAFFCFWCSNKLHHMAITRMLHAPLTFFDTTPQGRITHRFSKDVDAVDNIVGETLRVFISTMVQVLGTIIVVAVVVPWFLAIAFVVLLVYMWTGMYYRPSARELRRLNNLLRSRIYEHFGESLSGLRTLKGFDAVPRFVNDNATRIDTENTAYWLSIACLRWLNLRLDLCGATLVLAAGLLVVGLRDTIGPSSGGVVMSYIVTAQTLFGNMIRQSAEIENNMNSVERILHYAYNVDQEPAHDNKTIDLDLRDKAWPQAGRIQFESLTLSHRPDLEPSLRDVTLDIKPGEKVGIVGRTGAGKTTLVSALLRTAEPSNGRILIDGIDIHTIGLHLLRSSLSIINQDSVLLAGTVRYNLDPFQEHSDSWLRQCLIRVGLGNDHTNYYGTTSEAQGGEVDGIASNVVKQNDSDCSTGHSLDLDSVVMENGANISQGQRSLISIARAMVRRSQVVILDEATSSIDGKADAELHIMLNKVMDAATVLTVAHRLDTIIATCNKVIVMDGGRVAEFGSIQDLFSRPDTLFRALCDASKLVVKEPLVTGAAQ